MGNNVTKFKIGDLAGVESCRECEDCKSSHEQFCHDGLQTYGSIDKNGQPTYSGYSNTIVVNEDFTFHISEELDLAATALLSL